MNIIEFENKIQKLSALIECKYKISILNEIKSIKHNLKAIEHFKIRILDIIKQEKIIKILNDKINTSLNFINEYCIKSNLNIKLEKNK